MRTRTPLGCLALVCLTLLSAVSVRQAYASSSDFGESKATAIEVCRPAGERAYLSRLVCPTGESPSYKRVGSFGSRNQVPDTLSTEQTKAILEGMNRYAALMPGEPDYHVIDGYEVICGETKQMAYFDMYHCDQPAPTQAIRGLGIRPAQSGTETAASATPNSELDSLFQKLSAGATPAQYDQITGAIKSSQALMTQMNKLASSGKLTEIVVVSQEAFPRKQDAPFEAYIDNTKFVLSSGLLNRLLLNRRPNYVAKSDDIFPNHCLFVLGHLAFHVTTAEEMKKVDAEFERKVKELSSSPGRHDYTDILLSRQQRKLENEASAYIQAWNYVVDAAIQSNGNRLLSGSQFVALFTNLRYLTYFDKALRLPENSLQFSKTGSIDMTERNLGAMVSSLKVSGMADFE